MVAAQHLYEAHGFVRVPGDDPRQGQCRLLSELRLPSRKANIQLAGQVVGPADQLFQIIDPTSLMVEALVFDQADPDAVHEATASVTGGDAAAIATQQALSNAFMSTLR